ncbi:hypothetical protein BGW39_011445 [Mortierella sp. 14UC]|nr:hypothetical protein BGW39_011445 [Mortierella sp. 14UC]
MTTVDENRYYDEAKKIYYPLTGIRPLAPDYMSVAYQQPVKLTTPKKPLVILDLNGTLFYSNDDFYKTRTYIKRPYFVELLHFLYANCRVMIWSSATRQRVQNMISGGGFVGLDKMDRVWNREHLQLCYKDFHRKVLTLKDLEFVWKEIEGERSKAKPGHLLPGGRYELRYDQTNTILIDDSPHKSQLQPHNSMIVPDFDKDRVQSGKDDELLKVVHYIKELLYQDNVSAYMRTRPFDTNSGYYRSDQFRSEVAILTEIPKGKQKKAKKREARKAVLEKEKREMAIEKAEAERLLAAQERKRRWAEEARQIEEARAAEMHLAARMAKVAGLPMELRTPAQRALPDWVVPTWRKQNLYRDNLHEQQEHAKASIDSTGVDGGAGPSGWAMSRTPVGPSRPSTISHVRDHKLQLLAHLSSPPFRYWIAAREVNLSKQLSRFYLDLCCSNQRDYDYQRRTGACRCRHHFGQNSDAT